MTEAEKGDSAEMREWLDALDSVEAFEGMDRADALLGRPSSLRRAARARGCPSPPIPPMSTRSTRRTSRDYPGDRTMESAIRHAIRWNAVAIVIKANKESSELGGHIASYQSAATLYDTGFMHFWRAASEAPWRRSRFISRAISRRAFTRAPFSKAG